MVVNDDGKVQGLPVNIPASDIFRKFGNGLDDDYIVGTAVILAGLELE